MEYEALDLYDQENPLTSALLFVQSAYTLDVTARLAVENRDVENLLNVAVLQRDLAIAMAGGNEEIDLTSTPIGFTVGSEIDNEEDEYDKENDGE